MRRSSKINKKSKKSRKLVGGGSVNIFLNARFTTGPVKNANVKGIVHITEAVGINIVRDVGTNFANFFGKSGFESKLYDEAKSKAFDKLEKMVSNKKYSVGNIKMDIETTDRTIFCHLVGTIYTLK
jgi:uncharacterized protein YbjQ (UPF0145 family)